MKAKLTFLSLLFSVALLAQVTNLPTIFNVGEEGISAFDVIPQSLSYDGSNRVYIRTADDEVAIYSNDLTLVKSFAINPTRRVDITIDKSRTVTRDGVISENVVFESSDLQVQEIYGSETGKAPDNWTNDDMKLYIEGIYGVTIVSIKLHPEDGTWFIYDMADYVNGSATGNYYGVDIFGKKYPRSAFLWRDGYLYSEDYIDYRDESEYSETYTDWSEINRDTMAAGDVQGSGLLFINYDYDHLTTEDGGNGFLLTQTLFNSDEKYEYITFPYEVLESEEGWFSPTIDEGRLTYMQYASFWYGSYYTGFDVMSEDGSILQSITFPQGFEMWEYVNAQISKLSDEYYIICQGEMNGSETLLIYKINRSELGSSVEQVCEPIKIGAYPNPANRNQTITIELNGENVGNEPTDLQVINMQGQVIKQQRIQIGQKQVQINTRNFSSGLHLIKAIQNGKNVGTEKVIVK